MSRPAPPRARDPGVRPARTFPTTHRSLVAAVGDTDPERRAIAWEELLRAYWRPVERYLERRFRLAAAEAEDLTQEFLARAVERDTFAAYDPERARFRTFLRTCLDRWVLNRLAEASRLKRGGGAVLSLEEIAPGAEPADRDDPEELFYREWLRALFERAVEALRAACDTPERKLRLRVFERHDLGDGAANPSYADLARELGLPVTQVTNHLAWARRELRRRVQDELRRQTGSEEEYRAEARRALGTDPG